MKKISLVWPLLAVIVVLAIPTVAAVVWLAGVVVSTAVSVLGTTVVVVAVAVATMTLVGLVVTLLVTLRWVVSRARFWRVVGRIGEGVFTALFGAAVIAVFVVFTAVLGHLVWTAVGWSPMSWFLGQVLPATGVLWWGEWLGTGLVGTVVALLAIAGGAVGVVFLFRGGFAVWDRRLKVVSALRRAWESGLLGGLVLFLLILLVGWVSINTAPLFANPVPVPAPAPVVPAPAETKSAPSVEREESVFSQNDWLETEKPPRSENGVSAEVQHDDADTYLIIQVSVPCWSGHRGWEVYKSIYGDSAARTLVSVWDTFVCVNGRQPSDEEIGDILIWSGYKSPLEIPEYGGLIILADGSPMDG
ncbi:MAG: hypothetical protein ABIG91_00080 [Patescibacteria group bacterium]